MFQRLWPPTVPSCAGLGQDKWVVDWLEGSGEWEVVTEVYLKWEQSWGSEDSPISRRW